MIPEQFKTPRLIVRKVRVEDAEDIFRNYATDLEVTRHLMWKPHSDIQATQHYLEYCESGWKKGSEFTYALEFGGSVVGCIGVKPDGFKWTLGYVLARSEWGKGLMPEAAGAVLKWLLAQSDIFRVWAFCDVDNVASARVLEKVGMKYEGVFKRWAIHPNAGDEPRDCKVFATTK